MSILNELIAEHYQTRDASKPSVPPSELLKQFRKEARERFLAGRKAETQYVRHLRAVAVQIDHVVRGMAPDGIIADVDRLVQVLNNYAETLRPWGESVAWRMIQDVAKRDGAAWAQHGRMIGRALQREIQYAPTGEAMRRLLRKRVEQITSIPRAAAERLYKLAGEAQIKGIRASEIAAEILRSGEVSESHAMMLARTGVSSTATALTRARAEYVGSEGYIWRTSKDRDVRLSHRAMEGKFVRWDSPPTLDHYVAHCGEFANCRCFPEVAVPERSR